MFPFGGSSNLGCANELDAEYVNVMHKYNNDDLDDQDIFTSFNCEYILIHHPSSILSFYSITNDIIIEQWEISNNTIWSIDDANFESAQSLILSNNGCLYFLKDKTNIITKICDDITIDTNSTNIHHSDILSHFTLDDLFDFNLSSTPYITNSDAEDLALNGNNIDPIPQIKLNQLWIPIMICIFGVISAVICLISCVIIKKNYIDPQCNCSDRSSNVDSISSITDPQPELDEDVHVNQEMITEDDDDDDRDDFINISQSDDDEVKEDKEDEYDVDDQGMDISDFRPESNDYSVTQRIKSMGYQSDEMYYNHNTGLAVPNVAFDRHSMGNSSISSESELDLRIKGSLRLAVIPDIDCVRNKTLDLVIATDDDEDENDEYNTDEDNEDNKSVIYHHIP